MTRNGLKSLPGGQNAWDRVRRMDEAISRLGSEASYISQSAMRESAIEVLDLARQVANSFSSYTNLRRLVRKEWEDLQSELNELACYFREPGIR